jgi:L-cystine uptake protein TcyP (sodium:dicarboxylate symporter family)
MLASFCTIVFTFDVLMCVIIASGNAFSYCEHRIININEKGSRSTYLWSCWSRNGSHVTIVNIVLEYLRVNGFEEFADSYPTEKLIVMVDKLFDILNSRSINSKGYKKAINANNAVSTIAFLNDARAYSLCIHIVQY